MANYRKVARRAARRYGLDPSIFERQIQQESGFRPNARSGAGALGIAQIIPETAKSWGVNPNDPKAALDAAAKHMAGYVQKYGSYKNALVAYNAGPGAVGKALPAETQGYISKILGGKDPGSGSTTSTTTTTPGTLSPVGTAVNVAAALAAVTPQPTEPAPTAPDLPDVLNPQAGILNPTGYQTPQAPTPPPARPSMKAVLDKLAQMQDTPTTVTPGTTTTTTSGGGSSVKGSQIKELIFNDGGKGFGIKDGKDVDGASVFSSVWGGHKTHVHVAAGPKTTVRLGKIAQKQFGLDVGENPHFGGVDPVHVPGSYHYKGEAIDVSGDPKQMEAFAHYVERYSRRRR